MIFYFSGGCAGFEPERWMKHEQGSVCVMPSFWTTLESNSKWREMNKTLKSDPRMIKLEAARVAAMQGEPEPDTRHTIRS